MSSRNTPSVVLSPTDYQFPLPSPIQGKPVTRDPGSPSSSLVDYVHLGPVTPRPMKTQDWGSIYISESIEPCQELDNVSVDMRALSISESSDPPSSGRPSRQEGFLDANYAAPSELVYKRSRLETAELANGAGRILHVLFTRLEPFGVLISIQQDLTLGNVVMRQVSEKVENEISFNHPFDFGVAVEGKHYHPEEVTWDANAGRLYAKGTSRLGKRRIINGAIDIEGLIHSVQMDQFDSDSLPRTLRAKTWEESLAEADKPTLLRTLAVEGGRREPVVDTMNGREAVDLIEVDRAFDCILMSLGIPL
ncbi:hypothetical protein BS47DRAFT_1360341 [Hydnum rufescens UP504]|uniref:Uncharacterized protein n=1 Tax=Hydnum rufescens UP504 TaxID=1448309 RepID=A0A9P6B557_9AGAM|nr:hypothetical protein BS47DRAFT_1360341 [Hydnum rufescens UP504]